MVAGRLVVTRVFQWLVVACILVAAPAGAATVKVMTYNTHHGGQATSPTTTGGQLDTIAAQNPDVVVLQEAYAWQLSDYVNGLNSRLGATAWHGTVAEHCKSGTRPSCTYFPGESVMILTRLSTLQVDSQLIWAADDYWVARATIHMQVALGDGTPVNIFVCHLPAMTDAAASRVAYVSTFETWAGTFAGPRLVGGDFNDGPGATPIVNMSQLYNDAWTVLGSGFGYTHPASTPTSRIDYWFSDIGGTEAVTSVNVVPDSTDSDHRPVVATYDVAPATTTTITPTPTVPPTTSVETTLLDDTFTVLDRTKWPGGLFTGSQDATIPLSVTSGQFKIGPLKSATSVHYNGISTNAYSLASNGGAYVQLVQAPNVATQAYAMFAAGVDGNNFYRWYESASALVIEKKIAGAKTTLLNLPYDATADQFLRIRNEYNISTGFNEVVFETAADNGGVPGAFTVRYREAWNSHITLNAVKFELKAGTSERIASPGSAYWADFHAALNAK